MRSERPLLRLSAVNRTGAWQQLRAIVAGAMLFFMTPGAVELVEDIAHFVAHGDTFHDAGHDADHCCSGAFHFCGCHARTVAAPTQTASPDVLAARTWHRSAWPVVASDRGPADAHSLELSRPPAA